MKLKYIDSKRHNEFLFPALAEAIYESFYKAEKEIFNVANYRILDFVSILKIRCIF